MVLVQKKLCGRTMAGNLATCEHDPWQKTVTGCPSSVLWLKDQIISCEISKPIFIHSKSKISPFSKHQVVQSMSNMVGLISDIATQIPKVLPVLSGVVKTRIAGPDRCHRKDIYIYIVDRYLKYMTNTYIVYMFFLCIYIW